jgi:hypothetical protein
MGKSIINFKVDKSRKDGRSSWCKSCNALCSKKYRSSHIEKCRENNLLWQKNNPKKHSLHNKKWSQNNPEQKRLINSIWEQNNPEKVKIKRRKASLKKLSTLNGKLNNSISCMIYYSLRGNKNNAKWNSLVDFSLQELKIHLEKQFVKGMSWDNYGKKGWEIDHKIPLSVHNFKSANDIDFKKAWSLSNLQPMWGKENRIKSAKLRKPFQPSLAITV